MYNVRVCKNTNLHCDNTKLRIHVFVYNIIIKLTRLLLMFTQCFWQVARLQLQVYEQLVQLKDTGRYSAINEALDDLNSNLMDVTKVRYPHVRSDYFSVYYTPNSATYYYFIFI